MQTFVVFNVDIDMTKRLDFDYHEPRIKNDVYESLTSKTISEWAGESCLTTSAFYPAITPFYQKKGESEELIPFIRVEDTRKLLLDFDETVFLPSELVTKYSKNIKTVVPGDIVITKGGEYIGEASLVPNYYEEYAICRDILALRTTNSSISAEYICSYLQSQHGKAELLRTKSVQGQPHLTLEKVYQIKIPYIGEDSEEEIKELWSSFYELIKESNFHLNKSKKIINDFLENKVEYYQSTSFFTKNLDSAQITQRIDVDYYYEGWSRLIKELEMLGIKFEAVKFSTESIDESDPQKIYSYVTISDIDDRSGMIKNYRDLPTHELPSRAKRAIKYKDLLVSSLIGSKDKIAIVERNDDNLVATNGFYIIRSDYLEPEVLYAIFRSKFYDLFIDQMATGAIMSAITNKYFSKLKLPCIDLDHQKEIVDEIQNYLLKRKYAFDNLQDAIAKFDELL